MSERYSKLREYLSKETYPHFFHYKCVGKNSTLFKDAIEALMKRHPGLKEKNRNQTPSKSHVSITMTYEAKSADVIISIFKELELIPDLVIIL